MNLEIILVRTVLVLTAALSVGISLWGGYYLVSGLIFFVICYPLSMLAVRWEARLKKRTAARPATQTTGEEATRDE